MATSEARYNLESSLHDHRIFGLPALVSGFLFMPMWGMCMTHIILCCFGDKRWRGSGPHTEDQLLCHDCDNPKRVLPHTLMYAKILFFKHTASKMLKLPPNICSPDGKMQNILLSHPLIPFQTETTSRRR